MKVLRRAHRLRDIDGDGVWAELWKSNGLLLSFFDCPALDRMRVDHRSPDITITQQFLNRAYIVIGEFSR